MVAAAVRSIPPSELTFFDPVRLIPQGVVHGTARWPSDQGPITFCRFLIRAEAVPVIYDKITCKICIRDLRAYIRCLLLRLDDGVQK